ncbi:hypothetical protein BDP27DRAFT_1435483 [Rhodocollybia butyracea]|uniref:Uncharacterized protein n=1 Tax=Rhodocollybia butyracea TaxID=206335 RepID=A0A9P5P5Z7_9AGAR|nr:hypothetical protein BDP27DRAFT_1435483 [Rhodocollybia butyracea]
MPRPRATTSIPVTLTTVNAPKNLDPHAGDEVSPFVAGMTETQADTSVPHKTRGVAVTGSASGVVPSTRGPRLKQAEVQAQAQDAQEELRTAWEALDLLRDE